MVGARGLHARMAREHIFVQSWQRRIFLVMTWHLDIIPPSHGVTC
jgi:hypothetical protein